MQLLTSKVWKSSTHKVISIVVVVLLILFIYLTERDTAREREHKQGEWERSSLPAEQGALVRLDPPGIMT